MRNDMHMRLFESGNQQERRNLRFCKIINLTWGQSISHRAINFTRLYGGGDVNSDVTPLTMLGYIALLTQTRLEEEKRKKRKRKRKK